MFLSREISMVDAKPGDVFAVAYGKNKSRGEVFRMGKVIAVRDLTVEPVAYETMRYNRIKRSRYLVTLVEACGAIRCFYAQDVADASRRVTWLGKLVMWFCGVSFPAAA